MPLAAKGPSPRKLALRCLRNIEKRKGFSNRLLDEQLERNPQLDPRDRGLVTNLVYGVLRHQSRLDAHINAVAKKPSGLKGELRAALRIATYEILELERPMPIASAECSRALASMDRRGTLRPVVGGILSSIDHSWQERETSWVTPQEQIIYRYSIPSWLAHRWFKNLGPEIALARAKASAQIPWIDLRVEPERENTPKPSHSESESSPAATPVSDSANKFNEAEARRQDIASRLRADYPQATLECPEDFVSCIRIRGAGDLFYGPLYEQGQISIQSLGSQQAAKALEPQAGERILDACCGMGTKSAQIAGALQGHGQLIAADQNEERLSHLTGQFQRLGLSTEAPFLHALSCDLLDPAALDNADLQENLDAALLDAPCTGLGNLARHPELRWNRSPEDIADRVALQRALLWATLARLRSGGRLLYSVCSLEPEEGPQIIAWALKQEQSRPLQLEYEATFTPETQDCDGFYLARLRLG